MKNTAPRPARPNLPETPKSACRGAARAWPDCPPDFDPAEQRRYGGAPARLLARIAPHFIKMRKLNGVSLFLEVFARLSDRLANALYIYTRVKDALRELNAPLVIKTGYQPPRRRPRRAAKPAADRTMNWKAIRKSGGFDPRLTSHAGIKDRVKALRRNARAAFRRQRALVQSPDYFDGATALSTARPRAPDGYIFGEIWPPVPLPKRITPEVQLVEQAPPDPWDQASRDSRVLGYDEFYAIYNRPAFEAEGVHIAPPNGRRHQTKADSRAPPNSSP